VIAIVHEAGGLTSLAHPGISIDDARLPSLRDLGLDALEAFHTEHDAAAVARYIEAASKLGLAVTGGSDFHGDPLHGGAPGSVSLPLEHWVRFRSRPRRAP
jgi:predicted metal-dependent phosphoesterase TrpH